MNKPIFVSISAHNETGQRTSLREIIFDEPGEFWDYYKNAKAEGGATINVYFYDPRENIDKFALYNNAMKNNFVLFDVGGGNES